MSMFVKYSGCWWRLGPTECFLVTIPHSCDHLCSNTRTCEDSHQKCMEGRHMRARPWATEGGEGRVKVRCQRSFLHLHLTHFTTLLFRQYNHFNNCLPSSAPPPPPLPPTSVSTVRKDDDRFALLHTYQVLNKLIVFHQNVCEFAKCWNCGILAWIEGFIYFQFTGYFTLRQNKLQIK